MGLFDSQSSSNQTDSRTAASDNARLVRGAGKITESGATDFTKAHVNTGVSVAAGGKLNTGTINKKTVNKKNTTTLVGNQGTVNIGDPEASKNFSDTAKSLVDSFTQAFTTQTATSQATLATALAATGNKDAAPDLTSKLLDFLSAPKAATAPASAPDAGSGVISVPSGGSMFSDAGAGSDAISNFVNGKVNNALNPGQPSGIAGFIASASGKVALLLGGLVVAVGLFLFLRRRHA